MNQMNERERESNATVDIGNAEKILNLKRYPLYGISYIF